MEKSSTSLMPEKKQRKKFKVHYTWIYVTERCNLHCDYCFFRHMHGREISLDAVEQLFLLFEREEAAPSTLIFSGGEAFYASRGFPDARVERVQIDPKNVRAGIDNVMHVLSGAPGKINHRNAGSPDRFNYPPDIIERESLQSLFDQIERFPVPVVAAIRGRRMS